MHPSGSVLRIQPQFVSDSHIKAGFLLYTTAQNSVFSQHAEIDQLLSILFDRFVQSWILPPATCRSILHFPRQYIENTLARSVNTCIRWSEKQRTRSDSHTGVIALQQGHHLPGAAPLLCVFSICSSSFPSVKMNFFIVIPLISIYHKCNQIPQEE